MNNKVVTLGNQVANSIYEELDQVVNRLPNRQIIKLAVIQIGDDDASTIYIKHKRVACEKLGFGFELFKFNTDINEPEIFNVIERINKDNSITGCIIQLPIPKHISKYRILNGITPEKDIDCFHIENISGLYFGYSSARFIPATVYGIYAIIKYFNVITKGKTCVIIGKSNIVGKPLQMLLADEGDSACTTILCDKYTENLFGLTKIADILIVSAGVHHLINSPDILKDGVTIIDVGIHRVMDGDKYKIQGDVNYDAVKHKCKLITPSPGGVGPCTVAALMFNLVKAYQLQSVQYVKY